MEEKISINSTIYLNKNEDSNIVVNGFVKLFIGSGCITLNEVNLVKTSNNGYILNLPKKQYKDQYGSTKWKKLVSIEGSIEKEIKKQFKEFYKKNNNELEPMKDMDEVMNEMISNDSLKTPKNTQYEDNNNDIPWEE